MPEMNMTRFKQYIRFLSCITPYVIFHSIRRAITLFIAICGTIFLYFLLPIQNKKHIFAKYRKRKYTCGTELNYCYPSVTFTYFSYTQLIRF